MGSRLQSADLPKPLAATMSSSFDLTTYGCLRAPGSLRRRCSCFIVSRITGSGQRSTFVTTTKSGTLSAIAMPTCSFVIRVMPWLAPTTTIT